RALLDRLLSEKERVEKYIDAHQALMSPIRQIPSETLAEIFIWCFPYGIRSLEHAPLLVTTVCRHWRSVALNTAILWSSLHIHLPPHLSEAVASRRAAGVAVWLERSCTLPISISL
ncbi:hypothetical protein BT96DRAFT_774739, partial [Gymnopus androsaceus JB14]